MHDNNKDPDYAFQYEYRVLSVENCVEVRCPQCQAKWRIKKSLKKEGYNVEPNQISL